MKRILISAIVAASTLASSIAFADRGDIKNTLAQVQAAPATVSSAARLPATEQHSATVTGIETRDFGGTGASRVQSGRRSVTAPAVRDRTYFGH
jgi:hypothetical protein